jgi:membrane dipeptidase
MAKQDFSPKFISLYFSFFSCQEGFIAVLNEAGLILDLSHLSLRTALESIHLSAGPTMISHTTARAVYDDPRGSVDALLQEFSARENSIVGFHKALHSAIEIFEDVPNLVPHLTSVS